MKKQITLSIIIIIGICILVLLVFRFNPAKKDIQPIQEFLVIEDFEFYTNEEPNRLWDVWIDGWDDNTNSSTIGYPDPYFEVGEHIVETKIVHNGFQSAPIIYDLESGIFSEVSISTAKLEIGKDWSAYSPDILTLWFYGNSDNDPTKMYIKLNNSKIYYKNPSHLTKENWRQWNINLSEFNVDLKNVYELGIGFDKIDKKSDGVGLVFIDDICLSRKVNLIFD